MDADAWFQVVGIAASFLIGLAGWIGLMGGGMKRLGDAMDLSAKIPNARPEDQPFLEARYYKLLRRGHFPRRAVFWLVIGLALYFGAFMTGALRCTTTGGWREAVAWIPIGLSLGALAVLGVLSRFVQSGEAEAGWRLHQLEKNALARIHATPLPAGANLDDHQWLVRGFARFSNLGSRWRARTSVRRVRVVLFVLLGVAAIAYATSWRTQWIIC